MGSIPLDCNWKTSTNKSFLRKKNVLENRLFCSASLFFKGFDVVIVVDDEDDDDDDDDDV